MFDLQLKRAQVALADGRLDEAFDLLKSPTLRAHRAGQKLLTRLSEAFVQRSRTHLSAHRLAPALEDCFCAEKLAGNIPAVVELRAVIGERIDSQRLQSQQQAEQLAQAREQLQNGWLSRGRKMLAQVDDRQAQCLLQNAEWLESEKDAAVSHIEQALKSGQAERAWRLYTGSCLRASLHPKAAAICERIGQQACKKLQAYLIDGQLALAVSCLDRFNGLADCYEAIGPLQQALDYSRDAVRQLQAGCYDAAICCLRKTQTLLPKARWIATAIEQAQTIAAARQLLQCGPLGILEGPAVVETSPPQTVDQAAIRYPEIRMKSDMTQHGDLNMTMRFILQMDGIGAYHVLCSDSVTMGPVSSSQRSDIELVTAPDVRPRRIERIDGDYFLSETTDPGRRQLLTDGDRVELSNRCRFKFNLSNPASGTASLIPSSGRFPRADINGVILMDREILIGPQRNHHIQTGQISEAVTLLVKDGQLLCRSDQPVYAGGKPVDRRFSLPMNQPVETGDLRFILLTHTD